MRYQMTCSNIDELIGILEQTKAELEPINGVAVLEIVSENGRLRPKVTSDVTLEFTLYGSDAVDQPSDYAWTSAA